MTFIKPTPTPALADLYAEDEARGVRPLSFDPAPAPPAAATPGIRELMALDGPVDWEAEQRERARLEAEERARALAQVVELELSRIEGEQPPNPRRRRWRG